MEATAWLDIARFGIEKTQKSKCNFFFQNALQNVVVNKFPALLFAQANRHNTHFLRRRRNESSVK